MLSTGTCILCQTKLIIPGHRSLLHVCVSVPFPGQPASNVGGFEAVHNRIRYVVPSPQDFEQVENEVHLPQLPAVFSANYKTAFCLLRMRNKVKLLPLMYVCAPLKYA